MKIKICGLRDADNVKALALLPIDYAGFIFYPPSARYVLQAGFEIDHITRVLPDHVRKTGVFVDASPEVILDRCQKFGLNAIQLHGKETPEDLAFLLQLFRDFPLPRPELIKAFSIGESFDFQQLEPFMDVCDLFLFDTKGNQPGGNGTAFNWDILSHYPFKKRFFLSGGIAPGMENAILHFAHPMLYGLDLNSRFEKSPGLKDVDKISVFIQSLLSN